MAEPQDGSRLNLTTLEGEAICLTDDEIDDVFDPYDLFRMEQGGRFEFVCEEGHHTITSEENLATCPWPDDEHACGEAIDRRVIKNLRFSKSGAPSGVTDD